MYTSVQIIDESVAVYTCSGCKQTVSLPAEGIFHLKPHAFRLMCQCGCQNQSYVETRMSLRKQTYISGTYTTAGQNTGMKSGSIRITNISWQGFGLEISRFKSCVIEHDIQSARNQWGVGGHLAAFRSHHLEIGDRIVIEFFLDDPKNSFISKSVVVKWIADRRLGVELSAPEAMEPSIRFYMIGLNPTQSKF